MKEAEEVLENELQVKSTCELDIENVGDDAPYIEMVRIVLRDLLKGDTNA